MVSLFFYCLLLCVTGEVSGLVRLEPLNNAVLLGSNASFNCSLEEEWVVMAWYFNKSLRLTIISGSAPPDNTPRFSVNSCSSGAAHCWEFVIIDVQRNDSVPVTCDVLIQSQPPQVSTAQLSVQEKGTVAIVGGNRTVIHGHQVEIWCVGSGWFPEPAVSWTMSGNAVNASYYRTSSELLGDLYNTTSVLSVPADVSATVACLASVAALTTPLSSSIYLVVEPEPTDWTVLIAVVASIGGFALLVLLILGIIFCCKRRKEAKSGYDKEMRRARTHSLRTISRSGQSNGQVNHGYATEDQTSVPPSEFNDSGYSQTNHSNNFENPDDVHDNQAANGHPSGCYTTQGSGFKKHRHLTIV